MRLNPNAWYSIFMFGFNVGLALSWGAVWTIIGFFLMATIVGIPIGIACLGIGAWPLKAVMSRRINQKVRWDNRDRSYGEEYEEEVPWEV